MAERHWVGGNAAWSATAGTKWALTNGGAGGQAVPTSADDVYLDSGSGGVTVTITTAANCLSLDCTGFTGTLAGSSTLSIYASVTLVGTMTLGYSGALTLRSINAASITSAGQVWGSSFAVNGAGGRWMFQDTFSNTGSMTLTNGFLDSNNFAVSATSWPSGGANISAGSRTYYMFGTSAGDYAISTGSLFSLTSAVTTIGNIDFTGFTGTWAANSNALTFVNSSADVTLTMGSGMTNSYTGVISRNSTGFKLNIQSNGVVFGGSVQNAGSNVINLLDAFSSTSSLLAAGGSTSSIVSNSFSISTLSGGASGAGTKTLTLGTTVWTLTGTSPVWTVSTTISMSGGTLKMTNSSVSVKTFAGNGQTYPNVVVSGTGSGVFLFTGANTFTAFSVDHNPATLQFTAGTNTTFGSFSATGTAINPITIQSFTAATHTLTKSGGGTVVVPYATVSYSIASPVTTWYAYPGGVDNGNNSNWLFSSPPLPNSVFFRGNF